MENEDDSDWDYEYHESETETFYVTLDLSSYSVPARNPSKGEKAPQASELPPTQPSQNTDPSAVNLDPRLAPPTDNRTPSAHTPVQAEDNEGPDAGASEQPQPARSLSEEDHIQILELHNRNPLISYQSQLYTCEWNSTLGTDVLLAANQTERSSGTGSQDTGIAPLRSFPGFDLVATSRIKLSARPVQAVPHARGPIAVTATVPPTAPVTTTSSLTPDDPASATSPIPSIASPSLTAPANTTTGGATTPIQIPVEESATPQRQNQAAFLSRLINIKRAKGEVDDVTVTVSPFPEVGRRGLATPYRGRGRSGGRGRRVGRARASGRGNIGAEHGDGGRYVVHSSEYQFSRPQEHNQGQEYEERPSVDAGSVDAQMTERDGVDGGAGDANIQIQTDHREMGDG